MSQVNWELVAEAEAAIAPHRTGTPSCNRIDEIRQEIAAGDVDTIWMLLTEVLYRGQTPLERREERTIYDNDMGFNQDDAKLFTRMARRHWRHREFSREEINLCRAHLPKYAKQYANWEAYGPVVLHTEP